ncbi:hypothetical protein WMY93_020591 [Mugilogobius chulae]|uniref:PID domain-containing protein n=1 Tax=Mugilogobius chulae TaxID=88201 RepID=A0AAW0NCJ1_9GOBI
MVVLMARGKMVRSRSAPDQQDRRTSRSRTQSRAAEGLQDDLPRFESEDAQLIAQSIGQSFSVAYQEFLRANGIDPEDLSQREYSDLLSTQDMYNEDSSTSPSLRTVATCTSRSRRGRSWAWSS